MITRVFKQLVLVLPTLLPLSAFAADMTPLPPLEHIHYEKTVPVFTWTGLYLGGNIGAHNSRSASIVSLGGIWDKSAAGVNGNSASTIMHPNGVAYGIQAGYNYQIQNYVVGAEADFNGISLYRSRVSQPIGPDPFYADTRVYSNSIKAHWYSTLRARLGYNIADTVLVYATAGAAFTALKGTEGITSSTNAASGQNYVKLGSISSQRTGWAAGAGAEYAIANNWTLKAEYLFVSFGDFKFNTIVGNTITHSALFTESIKQTLTMSVARAGFNYKF